jgi:hypothetical protein
VFVYLRVLVQLGSLCFLRKRRLEFEYLHLEWLPWCGEGVCAACRSCPSINYTIRVWLSGFMAAAAFGEWREEILYVCKIALPNFIVRGAEL